MSKSILKSLEVIEEQIAEIRSEIGGGEVEMPGSVEEIQALEKEKALEICKGLNIDVEGLKTSAVKELLVTLLHVQDNDEDELDEDSVNALADAVGIKKEKKMEKTVAALKEYFAGEEGTAAPEEEAKDEDADDEDDKKSKKSKKSKDDDDDDDDDDKDKSDDDDDDDDKSKDDDDDDDDAKDEDSDDDDKDKSDDDDDDDTKKDEPEDDGVDREKIAKKAKLPKESVMKTRLEEFNEAVDEDDQINVKKLGTEKAYRKLIEKLVDSEGDVADWGAWYLTNGEYMCCGLPTKETKIKGVKGDACKCVVTGKAFKVLPEGGLEEIED
jgi:hypothetical protein